MKHRVDAVFKAPARYWLVCLLIIHTFMLGYGAWIHGPGWDEVGHLPAGLSYWWYGDTNAYRVNPPLVRAVATWPLSLFDLSIPFHWDRGDTIYRPEWAMGRQFWSDHGRDAFWYLTLARWVCIPWSLLAAVVIYRWSSRLFGEGAGLFSAFLWCFSPLVLANAQMITPDIAATALGILAHFAFLRLIHSGDWADACVVGVLLGIAQLCKFTWVVFFVLWPALWIARLCYLRIQSGGELSNARRAAGLLICTVGVSLLIINIGYEFDGTLTRLGEYRFVSRSLQGGSEASPATNRFSESVIGRLPVPLPRNYVLGIDRQKYDFERGFSSYLRGQWRDQGWWYYYAYGLLVKVPTGYLVLFVLAVVIGIRHVCWEHFFLLSPAIVVFALVSAQTGFNHHLRYVLPCFPFVFVWMGSVWSWSKHHQWRRYAVVALTMTSVFSSAWVFPHSHAYFNAIAGGPYRGHDHLLDSNIDWGQDILLLSRWVAENPDKPLDGIAYSLDGLIDLKVLGLVQQRPPIGRQDEPSQDQDRQQFGPRPGRYAVFVRPLRESDKKYDYFRFFEPAYCLGYTVYIYELSDRDVQRYSDAFKKGG